MAYLLVPNYFEENKPEDWMGVGHETGHHIYRQAEGLREEIEVTIAKVLSEAKVSVNGQLKPISDPQRRLWFNWLEEIFADLVGVVTLGAAFIYTQRMIALAAGFHEPVEPALRPADPSDLEHQYLQRLQEGQDKTHPILWTN